MKSPVQFQKAIKLKIKSLPYGYYAEIDCVNKAEWSEHLQQFDDANIYQTWSYGAIRWGEDHLSHLVLKRDEEIIGLAQVIIVRVPILRAGIAYIPWGPIWQKKGNRNRVEDLGLIISALSEEYVMKRKLLLKIAPNIIEDGSNEIHSVFQERGFQSNPSFLSYRTLILDLSPTLDELRKKLDQKWRNMLNQAEKKALKIIEGETDELYEAFLILQKEMLTRKKYVPGVDYDEFREIQKDLPEQLKMKIMVCEYESKPVAAAIFSAIGNTGIYLLGATGNSGLHLKSSYLLQWRAIKWLKENGYRWYDLGGIDPKLNPGVYHFKAGLGGRESYHVGQFELWTSPASFLIVNLGNRFRNLIRKIKQIS